MTTATEPQARVRAHGHDAAPADVFVVFGISGDLAKVMTFHSLYRLEQRGLLDCPIVGVAVDDWSVDQLKDRAKAVVDWAGSELTHQRVGRISVGQDE